MKNNIAKDRTECIEPKIGIRQKWSRVVKPNDRQHWGAIIPISNSNDGGFKDFNGSFHACTDDTFSKFILRPGIPGPEPVDPVR